MPHKTKATRFGEAAGAVLVLCLLAIIVALTAKFITFIF